MGMGCEILYLRPGYLVVPDAGISLASGEITRVQEITPLLQRAIDGGAVQVISMPDPVQVPAQVPVSIKETMPVFPDIKKKPVPPIKRKR